MELIEALATRRTNSAFGDAAPPREVVAEIIEAATWAPNHRHTEPWRFFVLAGGARTELGDCVAAEMQADGATDAQIESTRKKLVRSPVVVVVGQAGSPNDPVLDLEDYAACCCATQNLLLAAHARGLASKWSTGALATMAAAKEYLGLAPHDRIVAYVYLGYPDADAQPEHAQRAPAPIDWRGFESG
jgi:nitroreductase